MTLGDLLAADAQRLLRRHQVTIAWLDLLQPVIERNATRAARSDRFERHEAIPGQPRRPLLQPDSPDEPEPGQPVPPLVRDQLRPVVGPGVELARIHTDDQSDAIARSQHADAVTLGRDIHFRSGSFDPHSPAGLGLLAHELTHVTQGEAGGEEHRARAVEQHVARSAVAPAAAQAYTPLAPFTAFNAPASPVPSALPVSPALSIAPVSPAALLPVHPMPASARTAQEPRAIPGLPSSGGVAMAADTDRPPATDPPRSIAPAEPNLDRLKQTLYRDIMSRIRVEFERGA